MNHEELTKMIHEWVLEYNSSESDLADRILNSIKPEVIIKHHYKTQWKEKVVVKDHIRNGWAMHKCKGEQHFICRNCFEVSLTPAPKCCHCGCDNTEGGMIKLLVFRKEEENDPN